MLCNLLLRILFIRYEHVRESINLSTQINKEIKLAICLKTVENNDSNEFVVAKLRWRLKTKTQRKGNRNTFFQTMSGNLESATFSISNHMKPRKLCYRARYSFENTMKSKTINANTCLYG